MNYRFKNEGLTEMKKFFKELTAVLTAIAIVLSIVPFVFADTEASSGRVYEGVCGEEDRVSIKWQLDSSTGKLVISGEGRMQSYIHIGPPWDNRIVKTAIIENGITNIGDSAFDWCRELESVEIAETVTEIGSRAFEDCRKLKEIVLPDSVQKIGDDAFKGCEALEKLNLPSSLSEIGTNITPYCYSLVSVTLPEENEHFYLDKSFVLYSKDKTVLFDSLCPNAVVNYSIPEGVKTISQVAFGSNDYIRSITIPASVETIQRSAFYGCDNLESVVFAPNSKLKTIETSVLYGCNKLNYVNLPQGTIEHIGEYFMEGSAFNRNANNWSNGVLYNGEYLLDTEYKLTGNLTVKEGTRLVASRAFYNNVSMIYFPASVERICYDYFGYYLPDAEKIRISPDNKFYTVDKDGVIFTKDKTVLIKFPSNTYPYDSYTVPEGVLEISGSAFAQSKLKEIKIAETVTTIGQSAIRACNNLESIEIPASVRVIENQAFCDSPALKTITFAEGSRLEKIGGSAFAGSVSIEYIEIPSTVKEIGDRAFDRCSSLRSVVFGEDSSIEVLGEAMFEKCNALKSVCIPEGVSSLNWRFFANCALLESVEFPSTLKEINGNIFSNSPNLSEIIINPENKFFSTDEFGVLYNKDKTRLIRCAPANPKMENYTIPDTVKEIAAYAFEGCNYLRNITIPEGIQFVGALAFENCTGLETVEYNAVRCFVFGEVTAPEGVYYALNGCDNIRKIIIGHNVEYIPPRAFAGNSVSSITIPSKVKEIAEAAFYCCGKINEIKFEENSSLKYIGNCAFAHCSNLSCVNIPDGVLEIEGYAFESCTKLEYIVIPASMDCLGMRFVDSYIETEKEIRYRGHEWQWEELIGKTENDVSAYDIIFNYGKTPIGRSDPATNIIVEGLFAEDYQGYVSLEAKECGEEEANIKLSNSLSFFSKGKLYDIKLVCEGETVQPAGKVTVRIPKPNGYNALTTKLYHIDDETGEKTRIPITIEDGFIVFTIDHFSYYAVVEELTVDILNNPGTKTINYGEKLNLTAVHNGTKGEKLLWYVDGKFQGEGSSLTVSPEEKGCEVKVVLVNANSNPVTDSDGNTVSDSQRIEVKSGFFMKLISFFKNLFGIDRTVVQ